MPFALPVLTLPEGGRENEALQLLLQELDAVLGMIGRQTCCVGKQGEAEGL